MKECKKMRRISVARLVFASPIVFAAACATAAQTADQTINVRVIPATAEERVANETKEKQLRKAAEEKAASEEAAKVNETNPKRLLSRARIIFINSETSFFEEVQLQNALRKRPEMDTLELAIVDGWDKKSVADIMVFIDRPLFTYTFTYRITDQRTGIILATGKVTAFDGNAAAPKLADRIIEEIRDAKGGAKPKK
jgi:hypothetical protein